MKTSLVNALLAVVAVAIAGCSSDNSNTLAADASGSVPQGSPCESSADCESPLSCGYAINNDAGSCKSTGICVAFGPISVVQACSCASPALPITVDIGTDYASQPIAQGVTCAGEGGTVTSPDAGGTPTPTPDAGGTTTKDSGSTPPKDAATGG